MGSVRDAPCRVWGVADTERMSRRRESVILDEGDVGRPTLEWEMGGKHIEAVEVYRVRLGRVVAIHCQAGRL